MYNPNVPSSNMGIAPISGQPSQPLGPTPMMGPPPPMMGGMPPPPVGTPPISSATEGLGGYGGSRAGRAGFSDRMQQMTAPPKPKPQPVQQLHGGGMVGGMGGMYGGMGGMYGGGMDGGGMMPPMPMPSMYQPSMMGYGGMGGMYGMGGDAWQVHGGGFGINRPNYPMGGYNNQNQRQPFQNYQQDVPSYTSANRSPFDGSFSTAPSASENSPYMRTRDISSNGMSSSGQPSFALNAENTGGMSGQPSFTNAYGSYYKDSASGDMALDPSQFAPSQTAAPVDQVADQKVNAQALFDRARSNQAGMSDEAKSMFGQTGNSFTNKSARRQFGADGYASGGMMAQQDTLHGRLGGQADSFNRRYDPYLSGKSPSSQVGDTFQPSGVSGGSGNPALSGLGAYTGLAMAEGGEVPRQTDPVKMALGGFIGNSTTRDYSDDDPFGTDDLLDSLGIPDFNPNKDFGGGGGGDDSGGDDGDEYSDVPVVNLDPNDLGHLEPVLIGDQPAPEPESGGDGDDDIKSMILAEAAKQVAGAKNDIQLADGTVLSESDLKPVVGTSGSVENLEKIRSLIGDNMVNQYNQAGLTIDAVDSAPVVGSGDAGPEIFTDVPNILGQNPISLLSPIAPSRIRRTPGGGIVPDTPIDFGGSYVPPRVSRYFSQSELLNGNETEAFFNRDTRRPDMLNIALPGGSSKTRIEDDGYANAMAAAQQVDKASSAVKAAGGSSVNSDIDYPDSMTIGEIVADQANRRAIAEANTEAGVLGMRGGSGFGYNFPKDDAAIQQTTVPSYLNQIETFPPILVPSEETYNPTSSLGADPAPSEVKLEMAPPTGGGLTAGGIADLLEQNTGMANYLQRFTPSTGDPEIYADPSNFDPNRPSTYKEELGGGEGYNRPVVTLEGMGIDPANYPTEEDLRRDRERFNTPGVGDVATAEMAKRFMDIYESGQQKNVGGDSATYQDADGNYRNPAPNEVTFPAEGGVFNRDDVIAYKRGILSGEPTVVSADPTQTAPAPAPATTATADTDSSGGSTPKSNFDFDFPNTGETGEVFIDPTDSKVYFDDRFNKTGPMSKAFSELVSLLSHGLIDLDKISAKQREKGFEAYKKTQTLAYDEKGRVVGVKDPEGRTILLGPQPPKADKVDDDCPPGFQRVEGVCVPTGRSRVAANPATAIEDAIASATLPNTLRPIVRDVVDDDEEEETSDVGGLTIRRPSYFAGGGAVSDGMGSAIDSFISAMGGSVKKKNLM